MAQLVQFIDVALSPQETALFLEGRGEHQAHCRRVRGGPELAVVADRRRGAPVSLTEIQLAPQDDGGTHVVYRERDLGIVALSVALTAFATARLRARRETLLGVRASPQPVRPKPSVSAVIDRGSASERGETMGEGDRCTSVLAPSR